MNLRIKINLLARQCGKCYQLLFDQPVIQFIRRCTVFWHILLEREEIQHNLVLNPILNLLNLVDIS